MKWIHIKGSTYKCPNCGTRFTIRKKWVCCPVCGQKLSGVKERGMSGIEELVKLISDSLTPEEIDECIRQGKEEAEKELAELKEQEHE